MGPPGGIQNAELLRDMILEEGYLQLEYQMHNERAVSSKALKEDDFP